ncbi:hypothetical protein L1987_17932 [Smallanthus sonchifolius]|uniref:Uncharacterized protein n=1 Tax=Smallanthus sonchifolius TaxID=185202 RepID=A0ACB9IZ64_9ASTR|nr:hypothetical protein L1987_17932 [Smallanthus sonchifolius]
MSSSSHRLTPPSTTSIQSFNVAVVFFSGTPPPWGASDSGCCSWSLYAQLTRSISASFALWVLLEQVKHLGTTTPSGTDLQALVMEIIVSFCMMFLTSAVATDSKAVGELADRPIQSVSSFKLRRMKSNEESVKERNSLSFVTSLSPQEITKLSLKVCLRAIEVRTSDFALWRWILRTLLVLV